MISNLERSARLYSYAAEVIQDIGEKMFSVKISDAVAQTWKQTMVAIRYMDCTIDNEPDVNQRNQLGVSAISFLRDETGDFNWENNQQLNESVSGLKVALSGFPHKNQAEFIDTLDRLRRVTEMVKVTGTGPEYAQQTRLEGQLMSRLLLTFIPYEDRDKPSFKKFSKYVIRLGRVSNSFDSIIDFRRDYRSGQTDLRPNLANQLSLALPNIRDFFAMVFQTNPSVAGELFVAMMCVSKSYSTRS